jgi:hypothetical protein
LAKKLFSKKEFQNKQFYKNQVQRMVERKQLSKKPSKFFLPVISVVVMGNTFVFSRRLFRMVDGVAWVFFWHNLTVLLFERGRERARERERERERGREGERAVCMSVGAFQKI